jgi:phosphoribosylformimino-5-aminoimidazole carboxamide ribotide isomerase
MSANCRLRGDFAAETTYSDDPAQVLERYIALGARRVHVVDLDGARDGTQTNFDVIRALACDSRVALQVGGGLRDRTRVETMLAAGVDRVVIGSLAVTTPAEVAEWMRALGSARFVLAFDVRVDVDGTPRVTTHGWQQSSLLDLWSAVDQFDDSGLIHVLCTDVARDGALTGPNCALYRAAVQRHPGIAWQASGGVATAADLGALAATGAAAAISGRALLENRIDPEELQPFLRAASFPA